jgi:hypothetical protein
VDLQISLHNQETQALSVLEMQVDQVVIQEVLDADHQVVVVELELLEPNNQVVMLVEMQEMEKILLQFSAQVVILIVVFMLVVEVVEQLLVELVEMQELVVAELVVDQQQQLAEQLTLAVVVAEQQTFQV